MDEEGVKEWIRQCLPRTPRNEQSLLVWVSFQAHLTDEVKADLNPWKIDVAVIPGGLTPVLQPLGKCLNKPFKDNVRRNPWHGWSAARSTILWLERRRHHQEIWYFDGCMKHGERSRWRWLISLSRPVESLTLWMELRWWAVQWRGARNWRWRRRRVRDREWRWEWWQVNCLSVESSSKNGSFRSHQIYKSSLTNNFILSL